MMYHTPVCSTQISYIHQLCQSPRPAGLEQGENLKFLCFHILMPIPRFCHCQHNLVDISMQWSTCCCLLDLNALHPEPNLAEADHLQEWSMFGPHCTVALGRASGACDLYASFHLPYEPDMGCWTMTFCLLVCNARNLVKHDALLHDLGICSMAIM